MKLALLGCDDEALDLVESALAGGQHVLVAAFDAAEFRPRLRTLAPLARLDDEWESLLVGTADVVIVARGRLDPSSETGFSASERRADQLRKLAQAAVPMLIVHPACEMIVAYEIEMIRAASGGVILPYVPELFHPGVDHVRSLSEGEASPLGPIEQIIFERSMLERSRAAVLVQFSRDAALLRRLLGTIRQVAASGGAGGEYRDPLAAGRAAPPPLSSVSVHLSGERPYPARWSVGPLDELAGAKLVLIGARGRATLRLPDEPLANWRLDVTTGPQECRNFPPFNAPLDALERLAAAIGQSEPAGTPWLDACRDLEAASAIDRSLEKGRAVALYTDEMTEEQSFKGVMAVGGCLTLAVTLAGVFLVVLVEALQLELRRSPAWRLWPLYLLTPILVFLVLQALGLVAKDSRKGGRHSPPGDQPSGAVAANRQELPIA